MDVLAADVASPMDVAVDASPIDTVPVDLVLLDVPVDLPALPDVATDVYVDTSTPDSAAPDAAAPDTSDVAAPPPLAPTIATFIDGALIG